MRSKNGLYYDGGYGAMAWSSANATCTNKGWRLPALSETNAYTSGGVPNYTASSWTSTIYSSIYHYYWDGNNYSTILDGYSLYVRCVR